MKPSTTQSRKPARQRPATLDRPRKEKVRLGTILVPVDFSKLSTKAFQYAVAFAAQFRAKLHLLHVGEFTPPVVAEFGYPAVPALEDISLLRREALRHLSTWQQKLGANHPVRTEVRTGIPHVEIIAAAKETKCDLIVIGTHGRGGLSRMLIGSTADRVIRLAMCPVLVVREKEKDFVRPVIKKFAPALDLAGRELEGL